MPHLALCRYSRSVLSSLRPSPLDAALAAGLLLYGLLEGVFTETPKPLGLHLIVTAAVMGSLAWRRRFPLAVLAGAAAALFVLDPGPQVAGLVAMVLAAYSAGLYTDDRLAPLGLLTAVAPFWFAYLLEGGAGSDFVATAVFFGGPWLVGRLARSRGQRLEEADSRAGRLEREQEERRAAAVSEERARIARELHDIVSHSISVITVQTQAVRRRLGPEHGREAEDLRGVETVARQAMAEMRRLLGILRVDGTGLDLHPQPGLAQLDALVVRTKEAGVAIELRVEGEPVPLPPGVDLAAYRVIQEALTNVLKHAAGARATVNLRYTNRLLEVEVEDDGEGIAAVGDGRGQGLIGMRERVLLYGGEFGSGIGKDGGFWVRARLPIKEEAVSG